MILFTLPLVLLKQMGIYGQLTAGRGAQVAGAGKALESDQ